MAANIPGRARSASAGPTASRSGRTSAAGPAWATTTGAPAAGCMETQSSICRERDGLGFAEACARLGVDPAHPVHPEQPNTPPIQPYAPQMLSTAYLAPLAPPDPLWQAAGWSLRKRAAPSCGAGRALRRAPI